MKRKYLDDNALLFLLMKLKDTFALKGEGGNGGEFPELPDFPDEFITVEQVEEIASTIAQSFGYQTAQDVLDAINTALEQQSVGFLQFKGAVDTFDELPTGFDADNNGWLYDVTDTQEAWYWFNDRWEQLDFTVNMADYWSKDELTVMTNEDINEMFEEAGL